ncbi:MAG: hypothetical protein ACK5P7_12785 [Bdellovibrio sp.]
MSKTTWLFKNSKNLLEQIHKTAISLGAKDISLALADTAAGAQALTKHFDFFISEPGRQSESLAALPLHCLRDLEGLNNWDDVHQVEQISEFLQNLGLQTLQDLQQLPPDSWELRWGTLGHHLRQKLAGTETHTWTPLVPTDTLTAYQFFEHPCQDQATLLHFIEQSLTELFIRLEGRSQRLEVLKLMLTCEYSNHKMPLQIAPTIKFRDLSLILKILRERLDKISLENPIKEWELEILPAFQAHQQLDFWEPQVKELDNLLRLQSVLHDRKVQSGFLRLRDEPVPERGFSLEHESFFSPLPTTDFVFINDSHRLMPVQSEHLQAAPRPTRLLEPPKPISHDEFQSLKLLHPHPLERLDLPWQNIARDYWLALNSQKQLLWIFRDLHWSSQGDQARYFLQGYFD